MQLRGDLCVRPPRGGKTGDLPLTRAESARARLRRAAQNGLRSLVPGECLRQKWAEGFCVLGKRQIESVRKLKRWGCLS